MACDRMLARWPGLCRAPIVPVTLADTHAGKVGPAGGEVLFDPVRTAARARAIPGGMVPVVAGAGYLSPIERPTDMAGMIL